MNNPICLICNSPDVTDYFHFGFNKLIALKCRNCRHVFIKNSPITSDNAADYYTMEDFEGDRRTQDIKYTNYYCDCFSDYESHTSSSLVLKQFQEKLDYLKLRFPQKGRLLDVGCATGVFLDMARKEGWEVEGVEISPDLASYARKNFSLKVHEHDLTQQKINTKPFQIITLFDLIEHIPDPNLMIAACQKLLVEDGLLLIRTPTEEGLLRNIAKVIFWASLTKVELPMHWFYSFEHIHSFSLKTLTLLLERHNFSVVNVFREEESLDRLDTPGYIKAALSGVNLISSVLDRQHKIAVIAKK